MVSGSSCVSSLVIIFRFFEAALEVETDEEKESDSECDLAGGLDVDGAGLAFSDSSSPSSGNGESPFADRHAYEFSGPRQVYADGTFTLLVLHFSC